MGLTRGIVVVSFGDRSQWIAGILRNLHHWTALPVVLYTDQHRVGVSVRQRVLSEKELLWPDSPRWGVRNCNLWSARACLEEFDLTCCLNDDMRIVSAGWEDGLALAEKFGCAVPLNPRVYVKYNALGADATEENRQWLQACPRMAPACNVSPLFFSRKDPGARLFLEDYERMLLHVCNRGTLAFWMASWRTGFTPLYLPEQWCVCESNARHIQEYRKVLQGKEIPIEPIMLHWGQKGVREVFSDAE